MRVGTIVVSGRGADCYMGQITKIAGKVATVKYADFKVARQVPLSQLRPVGR